MATNSCACANGSCKHGVNVDEEYHTCSLCRAPIYCSDACRVSDWIAHDCPNVTRVPSSPPKAMFAPYYYEDALTQEELAELPLGDAVFQERSYVFHNDNRNVAYYQTPARVQASLGTPIAANAVAENGRAPQVGGAKPGPDMIGDYYIRIILNGGAHQDIYGAMPADMIYAENSFNAKAKALAGYGSTLSEKLRGLRRRLYQQRSSYVFWPNMARSENQGNVVSTRQFGGDIRVELWITKKDGSATQLYSHVDAGYQLSRTPDGFWRNAGRAVKKAFSQHLQLKFGKERDTKQMQVLSYADAYNNGVLLTWTVRGDEAVLEDVEFITGTTLRPEPTAAAAVVVEAAVQERFRCDPRNLEDMVALCMALDEHLATQALVREVDAQHKQLELYAGQLKNHTYALQESGGVAPQASPISPQTNVALVAAMDALYTEIGASAAWWDKKAHGGVAVLEREVDKLVGKLTALRNKSGRLNSARKGALVRELKMVSSMIGKKIELLRVEGADVTKWNELRAKVDGAMQSK